jgi:hypothetical protein
MLASNVHPKIASERLGHSRVGITLDLYSHVVKGCSHVLEGLQENAVALVDDAMAKALQKRAAEQGSSRVAKEGWRPPSPLAISKPWATWRSGYATVCKSDQFAFPLKARSENSEKFHPISNNRLARV